MRISLVGFVLLVIAACGVQESRQLSVAASGDQVYELTTASRDGIGKWYMGREISHVMGHLGAGWLERDEREQVERTDLLIENLPLRADSIVADIGAGTGYFTFPVARRVPQGRVLAVDIQPEMLSIVSQRSDAFGVTNVEPVLGSISDPGLTDASVDLIFIVDAYHEFSHPLEMGQAMAAALKPGGQLVLIEYRGEDPNVPIKRLHKMTQAQAKAEMAAIGLRWVRTEDFLPQQHFMLFAK
jgi:precorrin-6B methylase 2